MSSLHSEKDLPLRLLLVEDDEGDYFLTKTYVSEIQRLNINLTWEQDATRLEHHLQEQWDLVLLDGYLGAYSAVDLIPKIKAQAGQVPVVVLTGADNPSFDQAVLEAGADDYLLKDGLSATLLERIILYNLERSRQHQQTHHLNDELEQRVEIRTAELTRLNFALQENEQRARLLKEIATTVHNSSNELSMFQQVLKTLCYYTGWAVGHVLYSTSESDSSFLYAHEKVCFSNHTAYEVICQGELLTTEGDLSQELKKAGSLFQQALKGVAYAPIEANDNPRMAAAAALDLHSRLIFSLTIENHLLCFLEFFSPHTLDDVPAVQSMLEEVQQQLLAALKRKMSERARVLSERRLSQALRIGRMCSFIWDLNDDKIWFSPEAKTLFDTPLHLPRNREEMNTLVHPEDLEQVTHIWDSAINTMSNYTVDHRILTRDGEVHYVSIQGEIEYDLKTRKRRMIGSLQNIDERKANEFHLDGLKQAAETANTAKSTFLANMSHEIRTPLNAILGFTQILLRDPQLDVRHAQHVKMMSKSGEHLLGLINDILEMSKIEAGKIQLKEESVNLPELLSDLIGLFEPQALKKGLKLSIVYPETVPQWVVLDKGKLRQILLNILSNAFKFTASGAVEIRVFWKLGKLRFEVEDTGVGISESEIPLVFESFSQTQSGMLLQQGTGLGMPISRTYARMMGGDLTLTSEAGVGTVVELSLRCTLAESRSASDSETLHQKYEWVQSVEALPEGPPRILIADDDVANHQFLNAALSPLGFSTHIVEDGAAAVKAFQSWYPHLILMDVDMPRLNGIEAARKIRAESTGQQVPIIFVTASAFSHEKDQLLAAGANDILLKPLHVNTLLYTLEQRLGLTYQFSSPVSTPVQPSQGEAEVKEGSLTQDLNALSFFECEGLLSDIIEGDLDAFSEKLQAVDISEPLKKYLLQLSENYSFAEITDLLEKRLKAKI
jgi:signal transduction histidine kinase/DNA-binding response OmpR family regulator